jgi:hypothetical protein
MKSKQGREKFSEPWLATAILMISSTATLLAITDKNVALRKYFVERLNAERQNIKENP